MPTKAPPEPWIYLLRGVDSAATLKLDLHCIGGFALIAAFGAARTTADLDVLRTMPSPAADAAIQIAGRGSSLHRQLGVYIDPVAVATPPCEYESRLSEIYPGAFRRLRLLVPDSYDLALLKLDRNAPRDREDVKWLARSESFDLDVLQRRYEDELRSYLTGPVERHDLTLKLWIDMIEEGRRREKP